MYPLRRNRRLRANETIRSLVRETIITPNDFLVPLFVVEGKGVKEEIASMPNYYRLSLDNLSKEVKELWSLGLKAVLLFVKVEDKLKDNKGTEALNPNGLMQRAIKTVKDTCPEMLVMTDVALDPFSVYGHDGIIHAGEILNDETNSVLAEMSLSHAKAGADFVAPSDMMDGRIFEIRTLLEDEGFHNTGIMSYSAKYASAFFGTPLMTYLNDLDRDTLIITGATTSGCVRATVADAFSFGFHVIVVEDGVFDRGEVSHAINLFDMDQKYADVLSSSEVIEYLEKL